MINNTLLTRMGGVDVLTWNPLQPTDGEGGARLVNNFGDLLGPLLVERIVDGSKMRTVAPESSDIPVLVSIGSVLHFAPPGAVVWGTGVNFKLASKLPPDLQTIDFRSVRGPYSARIITAEGGRVPDVFGDPALLLPRFMPELKAWSRTGSGGLLIAPNLNDFEVMSAVAASHDYAVLDPRAPLNGVLRTIAESGFVIGSSLHAVAIADSLGIPARFIASPAEGVFKYRDYLAGTGRPLTRIASDIEDAVEIGGHTLPDVDLDALLSCFPKDLWDLASPRAHTVVFNDRDSIIAAWHNTRVASGPDEADSHRHFVHEVFPRAVAAGRAQIGQMDSAASPSLRIDFDESFAEAYAYRVALAAQLEHADVGASDSRLLATLDGGDPDQFLRALWLEREGPHALMRAVRSAAGLHVLSIALRTGTPTNNVLAIDVICRDETGNEHVAELPVFAMYHRQWSIDLCASFDVGSDAEIESVVVRVTDGDGSVSQIPVVRVSQELSTLAGYPHLVGSPLWRRDSTEASFQNGARTA